MKFFQSITKLSVALLTAGALLISCKSNVTLNVESGSSLSTVGGTVTGLTGGEWIKLSLNGTETINIPYVDGNEEFMFQTTLKSGTNYRVDLVTPSGTTKTCTPNGNAGTANGINISILVVCSNVASGTPGVTVLPTSGLVTSENGTTANFWIWLNSAPTSNVVIDLASSNTAEVTVTPSLTFTSGNWNTPQMVTLTGQNEFPLFNTADGPKVVTITPTVNVASDAAYLAVVPAAVSVTNLDNDSAGITTSVSSIFTSENGTIQTFTVVLNTQPTAGVSFTVSVPLPLDEIEISTDNVTYVDSKLISFTTLDWNIAKTIFVRGRDDAAFDGDIPISISFSAVTSTDGAYSPIVIPAIAATNFDNDGGASTPGIHVIPNTGLVTSEQGATTAQFGVVLQSQPSANVVLPVSCVSAECAPLAVNLTFMPGNWNVPQTVTVNSADDAVADGNQPYNVVIGADTTTADLNYRNMNPVDVSLTNLDNDTAGIYITPTAGLIVSEVGTATFTVRLTSSPLGTVTINLNDTVGGASGEVLYSAIPPLPLTFDNTNWNIPQTVTITGQNDLLTDGNKVVNITTTTGLVSSSNILDAYDGMAFPAATVTTIDVGAPGVTVTAPVLTTLSEAGPTTGSFSVVLNNQPTGNVIVPISASASAASEGSITAPFVGSGNLTFTTLNWNVPQIVQVTSIDDTMADGNKPFTIYVGKDASNTFGTALSGAAEYTPLNPTDVNFTNMDNETASVVLGVNSGTILYTSEEVTSSAHSATFNVRLSSAPVSGTATINLGMSVAGQANLSTTSLTFNDLNYFNPQPVTITSIDDAVLDGTMPYQVRVTSITGDPGVGRYDSLPLGSLQVNMIDLDNDTPGVKYTTVTGPLLNEASGTAVFKVELNSAVQAASVVQINFDATSAGGRATVSPAFVTFDPVTNLWNVPQTITITGVDDALLNGNLNFAVATNVAGTTDPNYSGLTLQSVNATIVDNENFGGGTITVTPSTGLIVSETAPSTATFDVVLNSDPLGATVTVPLYTNDATEGTIDKSSLTFDSVCPSPTCWSTVHTVTISGVEDYLQDGNKPFQIITQPSTSTNAMFAGIVAVPGGIGVTNIDNDTSNVIVMDPAPVGLTIGEAGQTDQIYLGLTTSPVPGVTIRIPVSISLTHQQISLDNVTWVNALNVDFTSLDWYVPKAVLVRSVQDTTMERISPLFAQPTFTVSLGPVSVPVGTDTNYNGMSVVPATINGVNNEDEKYIYVTTAVHKGDFDADATLANGPNGAVPNDVNPVHELDNFCMVDASYPGMGTYKAMTAVAGIRMASTTANAGDLQKDWVLKPNTTYNRKSDNAQIFTTNANAIYTAWPMVSGFHASAINAWTGLLSNWTYSGFTCSFWTIGTGGGSGYFGTAGATSSAAIGSASVACNSSYPLICVEQ